MKNNLAVKIPVLPVPDKLTPSIPSYLQTTYWWAYIDPRGVKIFERQWLVNLILWGNYNRLCDVVLQNFGAQLAGNNLQIACAYGNLTPRLELNMSADSGLDVIDILPIQLGNLAEKLLTESRVKLHCMDSTSLKFSDQHFGRALLFFLLHEQPLEVRKKTLAEAVRVLRPGGTITIVDYAKPDWFNPLRYLMTPILLLLEPYALDLWKEDVINWLPEHLNISIVSRQRFCGGLYQILVVQVN
jgi:ubiquinone/menaquinone biosynthesis C-methylase UbiE